MADTLIPKTKLDDVQERERGSFLQLRTISDAIKIVESEAVTKILLCVVYAPGRIQHFETTKELLLSRLKQMRGSDCIICDLDKDGWCWIGAAE